MTKKNCDLSRIQSQWQDWYSLLCPGSKLCQESVDKKLLTLGRAYEIRIQITTGTADATLPTSSSSCIIFLIRACRELVCSISFQLMNTNRTRSSFNQSLISLQLERSIQISFSLEALFKLLDAIQLSKYKWMVWPASLHHASSADSADYWN